MAVQLQRKLLSAKEIIAYDDKQLDQYLETNHRIVDIEDPENITEEFIQRLRARTHQPKSVPVDPQQLRARLLDAPAHKERSPSRASSPASTIFLTEEEERENSKQRQIDTYHKLVDSGGRPTHPLEHMDDIVNDPGELRDILSFWQERGNGLRYNWAVFGGQWEKWREFKRIQRHARVGRFQQESDFFWAVRNETWEEFAQEFPQVVNGPFGFPEYVQSAKDRLARNGFTRPFELDADIAKQDKLTEWIEDLNWEYMCYESHAYNVRSLQRHHDKAWKKLVDSGVLRPGETEEVICTLDHGIQRSAERHSAERAMELARRSLKAAEQAIALPRGSKIPLQKLQSRGDAAEAKLSIAEETHKRIKERNDCISNFCQSTKDFRISSSIAKRHLKLLRWMLQQVPLIEQELNTSGGPGSTRTTGMEVNLPDKPAAHASPNQAPTQIRDGHTASESSLAQSAYMAEKSNKRRRAENYGEDDAHRPKRAKRNTSINTRPASHAVASTGSTLAVQPGKQSRSSHGRERCADLRTQQNVVGDRPGPATTLPRRSARIAALSNPESGATLALTSRRSRRRHSS